MQHFSLLTGRAQAGSQGASLQDHTGNLAPSSSEVERILPSGSSTGPSLTEPTLLARLWEHPCHTSQPARPAAPGESCPRTRSKQPKGWKTPHRSGSYSFSPPSRTGEEFRSRGEGLACAWSKSGAGSGADISSLSTTGPSQPISTSRGRKVVLTGLTPSPPKHVVALPTKQEPARTGPVPVPERLPDSSPVLPPTASGTELFSACSSW